MYPVPDTARCLRQRFRPCNGGDAEPQAAVATNIPQNHLWQSSPRRRPVCKYCNRPGKNYGDEIVLLSYCVCPYLTRVV